MQKFPTCYDLLSPEVFRPGRPTLSISNELRERNIVLNADIARAMGQITKTLGLGGKHVKLGHIKDCCARLIDGWGIQCTQISDSHTMSTVAMTFAMTLSSESEEYNLQKISRAFIDGIEQGLACIAFYTRRSGYRNFQHSGTRKKLPSNTHSRGLMIS
jgi:hypothetical protein